jgi:transposase-like protein
VTLLELEKRFSNDEDCQQYFQRVRWPDGVTCPRCGTGSPYHTPRLSKWECRKCSYQFSLTAHTIFHGTRTPLRLWFVAIWLVSSSKRGISGKQLQRTLGVTYKTAWRMGTQIRLAMLKGSLAEKLCGLLAPPDEVSQKKSTWGRTGRGLLAQDIRFYLQACDGTSQAIEVKDRNTEQLRPIIEGAMRLEATLHIVDQLPHASNAALNILRAQQIQLLTFLCGSVRGRGPESCTSLLKRAVFGVYHQLSTKYLVAYLGEFALRFSHRHDRRFFECILAYC